MTKGVGGQTLVLEGVNPAETNVVDFFRMYSEKLYPESDIVDNKNRIKYLADRKSYMSFVLNSPELKPYLNQPIKKIFDDVIKDPANNPYLKYKESARHSATTFVGNKKYFVALEGQMEYGPTRFKNARLKKDASLTKGIPTPKVKKKKGAVYRPNHRVGGELAMAIAKWGADNPDKVETAQAALFMLHSGLRPDEMSNLQIGGLIHFDDVDEVGNNISHRGYLVYDAKNKKYTDAPAGPRGWAIVQQQLEMLKNKGVKFTDNTKVFPNTTSTEVTEMLKEIRVPRLRQVVLDGKINYIDYFDEAYDFRRFFLTSAAKLQGVDSKMLARSTGRDVTVVMKNAGSVDEYVAFLLGDYEAWESQAVRRNDKKITLQMSQFANVNVPKGQMIDMNVNLIKSAKHNIDIPLVPIDQTHEISGLVDIDDLDVSYESSKKNIQPPAEADNPMDTKSWIQKTGTPTPRKGGSGGLDGYGMLGAITGSTAFGTAMVVGEKVLGAVAPPAAALYETYDSFMNKNLSMTESALRGVTEFFPVSAADIEDLNKVRNFIKDNRDYYEEESKKGFIETQDRLRILNQPVQPEEEQGFLSEGQQQLR